MLELYIFILALVAIIVIVSRRNVIFKRKEKEEFKKEVSTKVEENRKIEQTENRVRFRDELAKGQGEQKFDFVKFKEEMRKADLAIAKKQWKDAKRYLIQASAVAKDEMIPSIKLAKVYMESGDFRKAETLYKRLLETDAENPEIYENLGKIFTKKRRYKEAIQAYVHAVELDEKDDQKFIALGRLYHLMMRYSLAAECFRRAAELKPRSVDYLFLLADSCSYDEDLDNALFTYERILTIEPYNELAKNRAGDLRLKIKESENFFANS
ncbi:tetratricopeptide repeat protein [Candidatus Peregrinibacteria bacterium]|nr:tetratricopeptide repeat protein [Candidatus Peregrinibacteria bacterium]